MPVPFSALQERVLSLVNNLKPGTTICPGMLCRKCGTTLRESRPELIELARGGMLVLTQKGLEIPDVSLPIRGPFRVARRKKGTVIFD
jgi:hypothetical protein